MCERAYVRMYNFLWCSSFRLVIALWMVAEECSNNTERKQDSFVSLYNDNNQFSRSDIIQRSEWKEEELKYTVCVCVSDVNNNTKIKQKSPNECAKINWWDGNLITILF